MDKSLIIVGMGAGVSRAVADRFAKEGYALGLIARSADKLELHARELREIGATVEVAQGDAVDPDSLQAAIHTLETELGDVEVLVYNAFAMTPKPASELTRDDIDADMTVNVYSALAAAQSVLPAMKKRGHGTVIFTGGGLALHPSAQAASLSVGKAALRSLAHVLNEELMPTGVHVGTVTIAGYVGQSEALEVNNIAEAFRSFLDAADMPAEQIVG